MELTKNIFFNTDKLVENTKVKISYTGQLFQDDSKEVSIHYGFGDDWNNVNDVIMEKTDLGYQALIYLDGRDSLNFCFKNSKNEWDNNEGKNYVFEIAPLPKDLIVVKEASLAKPHKLRKTYFYWKKIKYSIAAAIRYLPKLFSFNTNTEAVGEDNSIK